MSGKPIVLVAAKGFWSMRELVDQEVFRERFEFVHAMDFNLPPGKSERVAAVVVADQPFDGALMDWFPNLKTIARTGTGYDNIDLAAIRKRDIILTRVAAVNAEAVSDFALGLICVLVGKIVPMHADMMRNKWERRERIPLNDLSVGIIGLGAIGQSLIVRLKALNVKEITGWNRTHHERIENLVERHGLKLLEIPALVATSDVIVVALALTPETEGLVSREILKGVKPGVCLVNISRGAVVDEEALAEFMEEGRIGGVALDVFSVEPPNGSPFHLPFVHKLMRAAAAGRNVVLTPHNAGLTTTSTRDISLQVARNIVGVLDSATDGVEIV